MLAVRNVMAKIGHNAYAFFRACFILKQVCSDGNAGTETSKSYTCPSPLKGQYLTVQKTKSVVSGDEVLFINEVDVEVVTL